jgi:integrase
MKAPMQIRNAYKVRLVSHAVAQFLNRGQAIEGKIQTVLNDLKSETGLKSLKNLDGAKIEQYLESLQARVEQGELSRKTAATYVSALNAVINYINHHLDKELENVSAKEWGLSVGHRDYNIDKSVSQEAHQTFLNWLEQKAQETGNVNYRALAHSVELQREFGLRARESFCLKVVEKDISGEKLSISREDMPKNARPREIEIRTDAQRQALESARQFAQENGWRSLISPDMSLKEWKSFAYNAVNEFRQETGYTNYHFHGERHAYAHSMYSQLWEEKTGHSIECPVASGHSSKDSWFEYVCSETGLTREEVEQTDHEVRQAISEDLGHNREDITYTYLGK